MFHQWHVVLLFGFGLGWVARGALERWRKLRNKSLRLIKNVTPLGVVETTVSERQDMR